MRFLEKSGLAACVATLCTLHAPAALARPAAATPPAPSQEVDYERLEKDLDNLNDVFFRVLEDTWEGRPSADKTARENAFAALTMLWFGVATANIALPAGAAFIGTGIGALVGAPAGGIGAAPGAAAGGAIGLGTGVVAGTGLVVVASIATVPLYLEIEERFPANAGSAGGDEQGIAYFAVAAPVAYAGPYESLFIHLLDLSLDDRVHELADRWKKAKGLSASERQLLSHCGFLRDTVRRLSYVKRNKRLSPSSPTARPRSEFFDSAVRWIQADEQAVQDAWLAAFGVAALDVRCAGGKLTIKTPPSLREVGLPSEVTRSFPSIDVPRFPVGAKGGALDPYVRVKLAPGDFSIQLGKARVVPDGKDRDKIELTWKVSKGSRLLSGGVRYKWNDQKERPLGVHLRPTLSRDLVGRVYLRVAGHGLEVDRLELGTLRIGIEKPELTGVLAPLQELIDSLASAVKDCARDMFERMGLTRALGELTKASAESLQATLERQAASHGMCSIAKVDQLSASGGKLRARVRGTSYVGPSLEAFDEVLTRAKQATRVERKPRKQPKRLGGR